MRVEKITNPTKLPIDRNAVKDHLRIERDETAYDDDLDELIHTAAELVESECHVTLVSTQLRAKWDCPPCEIVRLPMWPITSVDAVKYLDTDGTLQTLSTSLYRTELVQCPATVRPAINEDWPSIQTDAIDGFRVEVTAGYSTAGTVPRIYRQMIKLLVGHWFKNREAAMVPSPMEIPIAYQTLRDHGRVNEFLEFIEQ